MSAQPKQQFSSPVQPAAQRPVRIVAKSECPSMTLPTQPQVAIPRYDFVGVAG